MTASKTRHSDPPFYPSSSRLRALRTRQFEPLAQRPLRPSRGQVAASIFLSGLLSLRM
jgi:hypothetical protein